MLPHHTVALEEAEQGRLTPRLKQQTSSAWASGGVASCGLAGRLAHRIGAAEFEAWLIAIPRQLVDVITAASTSTPSVDKVAAGGPTPLVCPSPVSPDESAGDACCFPPQATGHIQHVEREYER